MTEQEWREIEKMLADTRKRCPDIEYATPEQDEVFRAWADEAQQVANELRDLWIKLILAPKKPKEKKPIPPSTSQLNKREAAKVLRAWEAKQQQQNLF